MGKLAREQQIRLDVAQDAATAAGANGDRADLDIFYLLRLRDGDGKALGIAHAPRDALNQMRERLRLFEGDQAAHSGTFKACDT